MIGLLGGSGFYEFLDGARQVTVETPYGNPAAAYTVGTLAGVDVCFLPRHGAGHEYPPHRIPYRANLWGMREMGVDRVISPCAVGSLVIDIEPGDFVICDQLIDATWGRDGSFHDGPGATHISFADPYCEELRPIAAAATRAAGVTTHGAGTVVVIQGPRFSTRAESRAHAARGGSVINMTQAPEAALARELGLCFVNISVVTDYDVGVTGAIAPVTQEEVFRRFGESLDSLRTALHDLIPRAAKEPRRCECRRSAADANR